MREVGDEALRNAVLFASSCEREDQGERGKVQIELGRSHNTKHGRREREVNNCGFRSGYRQAFSLRY